MAKLTDEEKAKLKEEGYKLTLKALITIIIANIVKNSKRSILILKVRCPNKN